MDTTSKPGDRKRSRLNLAVGANEAFVKDFAGVLSVPPDILKKLGQCINTDRGFDLGDEAKLLEIWSGSGLPPAVLTDSCSVLKHLFGRVVADDVPVEDLISELRSFCAGRGIKGFGEREEALRDFLTPKVAYTERQMAEAFSHGVHPVLKSISAVIDLRCVFKEKNSLQFLTSVPVVEIRLGIESVSTEEERDVVFQTNEKGLEKLIKDLANYNEQLQAAKKVVSGAFPLYLPAEGESQ